MVATRVEPSTYPTAIVRGWQSAQDIRDKARDAALSEGVSDRVTPTDLLTC
jgi:hypothetical protein